MRLLRFPAHALRSNWTRAMVAMVLAFLVALWIVVRHQVAAEHRWSLDAAVAQNRNFAVALKEYTTRTLDAADVATAHIEQLYQDLKPGTGDIGAIRLSDAVTENLLFAGVAVFDSAGNLRASTTGSTVGNIAGEVRFQDIARDSERRLFISDPYYSPADGRALVAIARAIWRRDGAFGGIVVVRVPVERFVQFNSDSHLQPQDMISIIRLDGMTIARRTGNRVSFGEDLAGKLVMDRQAADPNGWYIGPSGLDGVPHLFTHRRLDRYPLFATVGTATDDVFGESDQRALWYMGGAALVSFLTLLLLAFHLRDLDERIVARQRFEELQNDFAHSMRVSSLEHMSAGLAHELNQPLAASANFLASAEFKMREAGVADHIQQDVGHARAQLLRAGEIIRRIRDYLSKGTAERRSESVARIVAESIELALTDRKHEVLRIDRRIAPDAEIIWADRVQIVQVLVNLIRNAAQAMERQRPGERQLTISADSVDAETTRIRVCDSGPGIPETIRNHLYMPFISTRGEDSLGLGLSICRQIVEAHGGIIEAENFAEGGACVSFTLPRRPCEP